MKPLLIYPMFFYIVYTSLLLLKTLLVRVKNIKSKQLNIKYLKSYQGYSVPEECIVHGRHFDNQFQIPLFFLITCLLGIVLIPQNTLLVNLAWGFCLSRVIHSYIHLGQNHPLKRAIAYGLGWILLISMWVVLLL